MSGRYHAAAPRADERVMKGERRRTAPRGSSPVDGSDKVPLGNLILFGIDPECICARAARAIRGPIFVAAVVQ